MSEPLLPPASQGTGRLRRQLGIVRALAVVGLVLVVVVAVWSVVGIVTLASQVSSLEAKVDALTAALDDERGAARESAGDAGASVTGSLPSPNPTSEAAPATGNLVTPSGAGRSGALVIGDPEAAKVVEVYVDYQCPYCQRWETEIGADLMARALQPGSGLAIRQYNMAFLGETNRSLDPPGASARAANAAACIYDHGGDESFVDFNTAIFSSPAEAARLETPALAALAGSLGASAQAIACIEEGRFMDFVAATTQAAFARGVTATPTVLVNGKVLRDSLNDPQLRSLLTM